jgi:hypothetical protein
MDDKDKIVKVLDKYVIREIEPSFGGEYLIKSNDLADEIIQAVSK